MMSESEVRWVRGVGYAGQVIVRTRWHALVPGMGENRPGVACGTNLSGQLQWVANSAITTMDGTKCDDCLAISAAWLETIVHSAARPYEPEPPEPKLAAPGTGHW